MYRFLLSGKWIAGFVLTIIFSLICLYLGNWQMSRKEDLDYRNSLITNNYRAEPLDFSSQPTIFTDFNFGQQWLPVRMQGHYLPQQQLLVRNRPYEGVNGFDVLVPFATEQGEYVLIDRGWLPAEAMDAAQVAGDIPAPPQGQVEVTARVHQGESPSGKSAPPGQVSSIDLAAIASETGLPLAQGAYGQLVSEKPAVKTPALALEPDLDTGPNLSYSVQWYVFALLCYVAYFWLARQKVRNDHLDAQVAAELESYYAQFYDQQGNYIGLEDEDLILRKMEMVDDMPAHMKAIVRPKLSKKRSQPSDEEVEDAYLDRLEKDQ